MADLTCLNQFRVGLQGDRIVCLAPMKYRMSHDEAINLAAWLVACADPVGSRFLTLFAAITNQDESDVLATMDEAGPQKRIREPERGADAHGATDRVDAMDRIARGECPHCGADRSGPSAEAHDRWCPNSGADLGKPPTDHELGGEG